MSRGGSYYNLVVGQGELEEGGIRPIPAHILPNRMQMEKRLQSKVQNTGWGHPKT